MYCRFFFWEPSIIYCKCIFSTFYDQVYYYCLLFSFICSARVRKVHSNCNQDWIKIKLWKLVPIGKIISKMASKIFWGITLLSEEDVLVWHLSCQKKMIQVKKSCSSHFLSEWTMCQIIGRVFKVVLKLPVSPQPTLLFPPSVVSSQLQ